MKATCDWCNTIVEAKNTYDPLQHSVFCSKGCRDADTVFRVWQSNENINRERHYAVLTGGDDAQEGEDQ